MRLRQNRGFTGIELLTSSAIVGTLVCAFLANLNRQPAQEKAHLLVCSLNMRAIAGAYQTLQIDLGNRPEWTDEIRELLVTRRYLSRWPRCPDYSTDSTPAEPKGGAYGQTKSGEIACVLHGTMSNPHSYHAPDSNGQHSESPMSLGLIGTALGPILALVALQRTRRAVITRQSRSTGEPPIVGYPDAARSTRWTGSVRSASSSLQSHVLVRIETQECHTRGGRCPVCGQRVDEDLGCCQECHTPHHLECFEWNRGCAIYGCGCETVEVSGS